MVIGLNSVSADYVTNYYYGNNGNLEINDVYVGDGLGQNIIGEAESDIYDLHNGVYNIALIGLGVTTTTTPTTTTPTTTQVGEGVTRYVFIRRGWI